MTSKTPTSTFPDSAAQASSRTDESGWFDFDYALLHVVPHVHVGSSQVVGVVLHSRTSGFIGIRFAIDDAKLHAQWPSLDIELVARELDALRSIAHGGKEAGAIGLLPPSERFHWMTAPRSAVVQPSDVHAGRTQDAESSLLELFARIVGSPI